MAQQDCAKELKRNEATTVAVNKCQQSSPTLTTPHRAQKRVPLRELANDEIDHETRLAPRRLVSAAINPAYSASNNDNTVLIFLNYTTMLCLLYI